VDVFITGTADPFEVEAALIAEVESPDKVGADVQFDALLCAVKEVPGADNVTDLFLAFLPAPPTLSDDLILNVRQRATLASIDINVIVVP